MIKLTKLQETDTEILVMDVRSSVIAEEKGVEAKVYLGKIIPINGGFRWESAWGSNSGQAATIDRCQHWITVCAKGMYK